MLSTASRDGTIRVWDTRVKGYADIDVPGASAVGAVNHIKNAHGVRGKTAKGVRSLPRAFLPNLTSPMLTLVPLCARNSALRRGA